jgi:hypothetical protein
MNFKEMSTMNKVMFIGIPILFVLCGVLVTVGVILHQEAGLLTACEDAQGRFDYEGDCFEVEWDRSQLPLSVYASSVNPHPPADPTSAAASVVRHTNTRLGFDMLTMAESAEEADIVIDVGVAQEVRDTRHWMTDANGAASHVRTDGNLRCYIVTWNTGTMELLDKVLTHELWHGLGLAHDDFEDSGMYPTVRADGSRMTALRMTDSDRVLLRERYHDN